MNQRLTNLLAALLLVGTAACGDATTPQGVPVDLMLATVPAVATNLPGPARQASALEITGLRLAVGEAGLGGADQFGCVDCDGDNEDGSRPRTVEVGLDGAPVLLETEMASPGTYSEIELELDPAGAMAGWPQGATVSIEGTYSGEPFEVFVASSGESRHPLAPPVVVEAMEVSTLSVVLSFPVTEWFTGPQGTLDPADAADLATIEANVRAFFFEDESEPEG